MYWDEKFKQFSNLDESEDSKILPQKTQTYFILLVKGWMITRNLFALIAIVNLNNGKNTL